jgi:predicted RNA-binding Zn-ribbon protein involved in translation (DUF1610 family)
LIGRNEKISRGNNSMESLDQEIEQNRLMAREHEKTANIFTVLCCIFTPLFLIGTFHYNSKAKYCRSRIYELEAQKQQNQQQNVGMYCHSCGHTIQEVIEYCPLCGERIKGIETIRATTAIMQQDAELQAMKAEELRLENRLKSFDKRNKFVIIASSIVMPVAVILAFFAPIAIGVLNLINLISLITTLINFGSIPKERNKPIKALVLTIAAFALTFGLFMLALFLSPENHTYNQPIMPLWRYF